MIARTGSAHAGGPGLTPEPNTGASPRVPACCWCGHDIRSDLRPAYTSWGALVIECISAEWCDMRSVARDCWTVEP